MEVERNHLVLFDFVCEKKSIHARISDSGSPCSLLALQKGTFLRDEVRKV